MQTTEQTKQTGARNAGGNKTITPRHAIPFEEFRGPEEQAALRHFSRIFWGVDEGRDGREYVRTAHILLRAAMMHPREMRQWLEDYRDSDDHRWFRPIEVTEEIPREVIRKCPEYRADRRAISRRRKHAR